MTLNTVLFAYWLETSHQKAEGSGMSELKIGLLQNPLPFDAFYQVATQ
jgi:hypothetical protein